MDTTLDTGIVPFDVAGFINRRRVLMTWIFTLAFAFGLLVTLLLPSVYRSVATILIEQQEIPEDLVRSTVTSFADQRIEMISQRVMTTTNLWGIIEKFDLYSDERKRQPREYIIDNMRDDIDRQIISADVVDPRSGRPVQATIAFSLSFDAKSPATAQRVANELTSLFLKENIKTRSDMADQAEKFLADEAEKIRQQIKQLGDGIANFKAANQDSLPEVQTLNVTTLQRIEQELREADRDLGSLDERRLYLEGELAKLSPHDRMITDSGASVLSPLGRLKMLETQRLQMLSQYSASHPDVQRTDREIAALRKQLGYKADNTAAQQQAVIARNELAMARKRYGDQHPEVKRLQRELEIVEASARENAASFSAAAENEALFEPDSPAWLQIKASLNALESQQKTLRQKKIELRTERTTYDQRMAAAPNVEKTYREMLADMEAASIKYNETKAKQAEAKLAKALETEQKGERFTLIEPPLQPETPVKPKRLLMFFMSFVLSVLLTLAIGYLFEMADKSIKDPGAIERLAGHAPLAVIPYIKTDAESQRDRTQWIVASLGLLTVLLLLVVCIHFFYKPLDVLYYLVMRRYGL
jgi:polysaccharide biosynthesis transport protein